MHNEAVPNFFQGVPKLLKAKCPHSGPPFTFSVFLCSLLCHLLLATVTDRVWDDIDFDSIQKTKEKRKKNKNTKTKQNKTFLFPFQTWHVSNSEKKKTTKTKHTHAPHENKTPQDLFSSACYRRYRYFTSSSGTQIIHNSVHISSLGPST